MQPRPQPPAYLRGPNPTTLRLRGVVVDLASNGLPGVTVLLDKTSLGVSTDANGKFELEFPLTAWQEGRSAITFSFGGYNPVRMPLTSKPRA